MAGLCLLSLGSGLWAQNVTVNPGAGSYATLADAFTAINAGTHTGAITISIVGNTTEPAGGAILNASGAGPASYTSVLITPSGARSISGTVTAGSPLIDLNGADNVTIDGLNASGNSLTISNATASATSGTSTIRLIGGATNNTITNATILGSASMAVATNGGTIFISTDANTPNGNDNNTISNNNLGPAGVNLPTKAVACNGSQSTTAIGNSGITVSNNNIFDYFGAAVTSSGVFVANGCNNWQITNNRFYQTATRTWTTGAMHRAIDINSSSGTFGAQGFTISGNIIGYASSTQTGVYTLTGSTGKFTGIFLSAITNGAGIAPSTISNNTVAAVSLAGVTSSGTGVSGAPIIGIMVNNGLVTTENNTIGSQTTTASIVYSTNTTSASEIFGIYNFSVDNWVARGNTVGGISIANAGSGNILFVGMRANTASGVTWTAENNIVGGNVADSIQTAATGAGSSMFGMMSNNAITTATGNTVRNMTTNAGTGSSGTASMIGMILTSTSSAAPHTLQRNTISNLSNTNATAAVTVAGMQLTGPTGLTNVISRNSISNLVAVSSSTSAAVNGINFSGGLFNLSNNFIRLGQDTTGADLTAGVALSGINELLGTNIFNHNTVLIQGSGVGGTVNTFALNSTVTVNTRSYRNNIFVNARSNGAGTGKHYAARFGGSSALPAGLSANNNLYFVSGTGGVLGFFNLLDHATLGAFQAATGVDAGSVSADPSFVSATNLRLTSLSPARDVGSNSVGVGVDFDGKSRPGANLLFDIGADEFDGIAPAANDIAATAFIDPANGSFKLAGIPFTPQASFSNLGTAAQTLIPVRYRILNAGNVEVYNATATIPSLNSTATATASFSAATLAAGSYTIIAIAELGTDTQPSNNTITGSLQVLAPLSGTYTVGTGGNFTSLTSPGGVFDAINTAGVSVSARFNILNDLNGETGAVGLNQIAGGASVAIRPASGVTATVTGSFNGCLVRLNGADNVTIDGSNIDGGSTRNLSFVNTSSAASVGVICITSLGIGAGAVNNTLRNLSVSAADPTTSLLAISVGGTIGVGGANNNNTVIDNVSVRRAVFGIFVSGDASSLTTGTVISNNDLTGTGPDRVRRVGIVLFNDNGAVIVGNRVGGIDSNESADSVGIGVGTQSVDNSVTVAGGGVINALVARNQINGVVSQSTTGFSAAGIAVAGGTGTNTIANNMITGVIGPSTAPDLAAGIFVAGSAASSTRVVYNSILMSGERGTVASQVPSYGIALTGTAGATVELRNNIAVNTQTSGGGSNALSFALGTGATAFTGLTASNNIYLTSGAQGSGFRSGSLTAAAGGSVINHATLAAWQTAISGDAASQFVDPLFVSPTDLHIQASSPASNAGVPIAGVTVDFDGETRSPTTPEIGADELGGGNLTITPTSINFGDQSVGSTSAAQTVTLANIGSASLQVTALTTAAAPFALSGGTCPALPITLAAGSNCTLSYTFSPTATGPANQTLTVTANAPGSGSIALSGNGVQGNLTITPTSINFGDQNVGTTSAAQTVTLGNSGTGALQVTALTAATAPFARSGGTCPALPITLAAGGSCTLSYTFAPTATGAANQNLTVTANAPGSGSIALSGNGVQGNLTITPNSINFGNQGVGTTSAAQTVTLANNGTASLQVTALTAATAPFARSGGTCTALPITLAAGSSCTLSYTFTPSATGAANQTLTVTADAPGSGSIALSGNGVAGVLTVSPNPANFGDQAVGTTSAPLTVTLSNTGTGSLDVTALPNPSAPFARSGGSCAAVPFTLPASGSCTVQYTYSPSATGAANQNVVISATPGGNTTLVLSGNGVQGNLTITPSSVNFGDQTVGTTSAAQTVTLGNSGTASLQVTTLTAATAPFARSGGTCSALPITLAAGSSCTLTYTFAPTATGAANQNLTVTADAPGSGSIALSGNGVQGNLTITPNSINFGDQNVGSASAAQTVTLGNSGTASLQVTALTAATAPFARSGGTCSALPITLAAGSSCTLSYTFTPSATGAANQTLTVTADAPGSGSIALSGNGVAGALTVSPNPANFGDQAVGTTSAPLTVTLSNTGAGSLDVTALPNPSAPFARSGGSCGAVPFTLPASGSCTVQYTYSPSAIGAVNQNVVISTTPGGNTTLVLSGNGVQGNLTITPSSVSFGNQLVGSTSAAQTVTLGNNGTASLQVTALTAATAPFARSGGTCPALPITLAAGGSCTLSYTFAPTASGAANQSLTVTADAPGSGSIALSGTGVQGNLTITPSSVSFGNQPVGTTSAAQTVTLGNNGTASLQVTALTAATAPFARSGGTCPALPITLAVGGNCTLSYTFAPTATGTANQSLTVTADAPGSGSIALSGNGTPSADLSISKSSNTGFLDFGLMQYTLVVSNAGPNAVSSATVLDNFAPSLSNVLWSCTGISGGACNASGTGSINQLVDLPVGASVVYSITATVALPLPVSISNTASVSVPLGTTDPVAGNNSATVLDVILLFVNGFESAPSFAAGVPLMPLPATVSGEFASLSLDTVAVNAAARGPVPGDVTAYAIAGNTVVVQARRIGSEVQMRLLIRDGRDWSIGAWTAVDANRAIRFEWSTGAVAPSGAAALIARLRN